MTGLKSKAARIPLVGIGVDSVLVCAEHQEMTWFNWAKDRLARWQARLDESRISECQFTPRAMQALTLAVKEAETLNHNYVGTEHVLLGLLQLKEGVCARVFHRLGVEAVDLRLRVLKMAPLADKPNQALEAAYTPRMKRVFVLAQKQARLLCHTYLGTEHLLLGLLEESEGVAGQALRGAGVTLQRAREEILRELDPNFSAPDTDGRAGS
jgi:ATP-dependent Clp protease ATP-binding subunit ClpC